MLTVCFTAGAALEAVPLRGVQREPRLCARRPLLLPRLRLRLPGHIYRGSIGSLEGV